MSNPKLKNIKSFDSVFSLNESSISEFSYRNVFNLLNKEKSKILLVGEVQSGKTKVILDLIKFSIENKEFAYDIIIIFGGTNNKLNDQTEDRLRNEYEEYTLRSKVAINKFNHQYIENVNINKSVIYIGPKIDKKLENIYAVIKNIPNISDKKILIIDDESDYGSLNTLDYRNATKYSSIIDELFKSLYKNGSGYIGITATPYANIHNKKTFPYQHIFSLPNKSNNGYTGISYFNKLNNFYINIDENEENLEKAGGLWDEQGRQLYFVFAVYIINLLIKKSMNLTKSNYSDLLINIEYEIKIHNRIKEDLASIIDSNKKTIFTFCKNLKIFAISLQKNIEINKEEVWKILDEINIVVLNGNEKNSIRKNYNIYIGGVLLSRGITYENLVVEYIDNFPKKHISADTLLQMCRWFGYREQLDKFNYLNVITSTRGIDALKEIEEFNDIFFKYENNHKGSHLKMAELKNKLDKVEINSSIVKGCSNGKR